MFLQRDKSADHYEHHQTTYRSTLAPWGHQFEGGTHRAQKPQHQAVNLPLHPESKVVHRYHPARSKIGRLLSVKELHH